ncbi:hypothetical protein GGC64_006079 [Mycobacterium sp. OAS707]|uniref:hypothetical protein n=1 Tax=Mycobacterium sp. OAS707 TaxID=2663822 RepID=UPI00178BB626|nr:hypothetical protein [Mycobacterium sp. OAS707]MBE1551992.1 hypothetical protein [Mycobacterium sp. OAS707]
MRLQLQQPDFRVVGACGRPLVQAGPGATEFVDEERRLPAMESVRDEYTHYLNRK